MFVAEETLRTTGQAGLTGLWMLAIFLLGLSVMAWLTVREASLYESRTAARRLRLSSAKAHIPDRENLSSWSRFWLGLRLRLRGQEFRDAVGPATSEGVTGYEIRLRREIDRLVGKEVYHGQKEQL